MINEKIVYYRKKNMMTQEDLAERIAVSRQTVAKWESGIVVPGLEYLIDLSDLFGITLDTLVREDDCTSCQKTEVESHSLSEFLVRAKRSTYASKKNKIDPTREGSHDYRYQENEYRYYDSFFGSSLFSGQEIVYEKDRTVWAMNYYGKVLSEDFSGDFLKEALSQVSVDRPYRGPEMLNRGEYLYICEVVGDVLSFEGKERIYYRNIKVYEGLFHGGMLE